VRLVISPAAADVIRKLPPSVKRGIREAIRTIAEEPTAGEPLQRDLAAYHKYTVRRFRIVYGIDRRRRVVTIVAVGPRTTIYEEIAEHLRRSRRGGSPAR
jgi:mRNA-degrading endonuclease RelE of RelBE toxin-antitoxin system